MASVRDAAGKISILDDKGQNSGREHLEVILDKCMHSAEINVDGASGCGWQ